MGQKKNTKKNVLASIPEPPQVAVPPTNPVSIKGSQKTPGPKITPEQIAQRAHDLWVNDGCRHGQDQQHWLEAEKQLKAELGAK